MRVPTLSLIIIILDMLAGIILPLVLAVYLKKKYQTGLRPFLVGAAVMLLFALVLEQLAHSLVLKSSVGAVIQSSTVLTAMYGGLMAGLFEETGRYLAMKKLLRNGWDNRGSALMYGAGHGGFEMMVLLVFGMLGNLLYTVLLNTGRGELLTGSLEGEALLTVQTAIQTLCETKPSLFLVSLVERLLALAAQLGLSVIVWKAAVGGEGKWFPVAILLHLALDAVAAIINGLGTPIAVTELAVAVMAALIVLLARKLWKTLPEQN